MIRIFIVKIFSLMVLLSGMVNANTAILEQAKEQEAFLFRIRNHLHEYPETAWKEDKSLAYIKNELQKIKPIQGRSLIIHEHYEGGLVADLLIESPRKFLLFRADIDALDVEEDTSHPFFSKIHGKMHACGHDVHSAMLLTAAKILLTDAIIEPTSNIRFIWQRAEENPGTDPKRYSGAFTLVKENILDKIDEVHGIHIWSKLPSGEVFSTSNAIMGTSTSIKIAIQASGGHSSAPHQGSNALRVANSVINALQEVHVRLLGPTESVSLEPTILNSGTTKNAMPASAELWYTLRTFLKPDELKIFENKLGDLVQNIAQQFNVNISIAFEEGYPVTFNTSTLFQKYKNYLNENGLSVQETTPILASEDFSFYLLQKPGVFWLLGAEQEGSGAHHSPTFNPDVRGFYKGVALWLLLATAKA